MSRSAGIAVVFLVAASGAAMAQPSCPTITDATKRLACYDALNSASNSSAGSILDFDDFVTDIASLRGKQIKVNIQAKQSSNLTFGYRSDVFGPFVLLDISGLSRDDRKKLNSDCSAATALCSVTVTGIATHTFGQPGIKVSSMTWN